jgi:hypothetical protein
MLYKNNFWWDCGPTNTTTAVCNGVAAVEAAIFGSGNDQVFDPEIRGISRANTGGLDPRPCADFAGAGWSWIDPLGVDGYNPTDPAGYTGAIDANYRPFDVVDYPGAFDPSVDIENSWASEWTALDFYGYLTNSVCAGGGCCVGRVGDANGLGGDEPTIGDISSMIDALFISGNSSPIACIDEADINQSGGAAPIYDDITIGDISILIDYLFITGSSLGLPDCL